MLLPYASYLRVYEPVELVGGAGGGAGEPRLETVTAGTLEQEQRASLMQAVASGTLPLAEGDLVGCYLMRHEDVLYVCPMDLAARCWVALASFTQDTDAMTRAMFFVADHAESAQERLVAWRLSNPGAVPHIRDSTWGVPRTWFLLVNQDERERYDVEGESSVRFRTSMAAARERLRSAYTVLSAMIDDADLLAELGDLGHWLGAFSDDSRVEVDYAGAAGLLGIELETDRSAAEIETALAAMGRRDFGSAGESYRHFVERWRVVNALERAN